MRIKAVMLVLLVAGIVLAAYLLVSNRELMPSQVDEVTQVCRQCHGAVPEYGTASYLHTKKSSFDCSRCHGDKGILGVTGNIHSGLQWLSVGTVIVTLTGIVTSFFIVTRKNRGNK